MKKFILLALALWAQFSWAGIVTIDTYTSKQGNEVLILGEHQNDQFDKISGSAFLHVFHCFVNIFKPHIIIQDS